MQDAPSRSGSVNCRCGCGKPLGKHPKQGFANRCYLSLSRLGQLPSRQCDGCGAELTKHQRKWCAECAERERRKHIDNWHERNIDHVRERRRESNVRYRQSDHGYIKARLGGIKRRYGLEPEDFYALFERQGGRCAVCSTELDLADRDRTGQLHVDHCHDSGKVRGILCGPCNRGLGCFFDDRDRLRAAIAYLDRVLGPDADS